MIIGTALYEEIAFRGVIFPQLFLKLANAKSSYRYRLFLAMLVSAVLFSLYHLPSLILILDLDKHEILIRLTGFLIPGIILSIAYISTNTLICNHICSQAFLINLSIDIIDLGYE
jgi:membrane protease YdiL (CAAX protease family)